MGRVILSTMYGANIFPPDIEEKISKIAKEKGELWRVDKELLDYIDNLECETYTLEEFRGLSDINNVVRLLRDNSVTYYYPSGDFSYICSFSVVKFDENRKWIIDEYDGVEGIEYIDDYEPVCEEIGFYRRKIE